MLTEKTVAIPDARARANVRAALLGAGAPVGIVSCEAHGDELVVTFDAALSGSELIDDVIAVHAAYAPRNGPLAPAQALAQAARGLSEPDLDATRVLETYLP